MNTLKGVIAATRRRGEIVPVESDLFIEPWYFILSSEQYVEEPGNGNEPDPDPDPGSGEWEGGLGVGEGGQGWYKFAMAPVKMGGLFNPHDISVSSTLNPEYSVQNVKNSAQMYVDILGWEEAYQTILSSITNTYTVTHKNIVRPYTSLPHPTNFISGQPDEGAASSWTVYSDLTSGTTLYLYGIDQEQHYIKINNPEQGYVPAPVEFDTFQKQMAFAFDSCEGPNCPADYSLNWSLEMVVEINFPAIMDWIMPPR